MLKVINSSNMIVINTFLYRYYIRVNIAIEDGKNL